MENNINRRQFIATATKAGISIAAASAAAYLLYDKKGPPAKPKAHDLVTFPDYSVPKITGQTISIVKGDDRTKSVDKAIDLLGGIERFVKPGDNVIIKPNAAFATSPALAATTNPQLIARVVRLCYDRGQAAKVYVTDNPINDPASCFTLSGIAKAATAAGAKLILPKENLFRNTTLAGAKLIKNWPVLYKPFEKADKLIAIAPVKDHHRSGASMTMKNFYGLLGGRRNIFHQDIHTIIAELSMMIKPTLVILDGTVSMISNGPTGGSFDDLKNTNTLIASCDMVAADSFGAQLLDLKVSDLPYLEKAQNAGVGTTDYNSLKPKFATVT
ncbi:MAG: DUF362 domain-containing protein [Planctomycetes bacterium]|nr:DUF362 domain-containing protein [Planctomycetota bacterium]